MCEVGPYESVHLFKGCIIHPRGMDGIIVKVHKISDIIIFFRLPPQLSSSEKNNFVLFRAVLYYIFWKEGMTQKKQHIKKKKEE